MHQTKFVFLVWSFRQICSCNLMGISLAIDLAKFIKPYALLHLGPASFVKPNMNCLRSQILRILTFSAPDYIPHPKTFQYFGNYTIWITTTFKPTSTNITQCPNCKQRWCFSFFKILILKRLFILGDLILKLNHCISQALIEYDKNSSQGQVLDFVWKLCESWNSLFSEGNLAVGIGLYWL